MLVLVLFVTGSGQAAEWRIEPELRIAGELDDNADLTDVTIDEQEISGYVADINARFIYDSPVTDFFMVPQLVFRDYGEPDPSSLVHRSPPP